MRLGHDAPTCGLLLRREQYWRRHLTTERDATPDLVLGSRSIFCFRANVCSMKGAACSERKLPTWRFFTSKDQLLAVQHNFICYMLSVFGCLFSA